MVNNQVAQSYVMTFAQIHFIHIVREMFQAIGALCAMYMAMESDNWIDFPMDLRINIRFGKKYFVKMENILKLWLADYWVFGFIGKLKSLL